MNIVKKRVQMSKENSVALMKGKREGKRERVLKEEDERVKHT